MNKITNNFGLIWNFVDMIYVKGIFNPMMDFKQTLSNWKWLNDIIVGYIYIYIYI